MSLSTIYSDGLVPHTASWQAFASGVKVKYVGYAHSIDCLLAKYKALSLAVRVAQILIL